MVWKGPVSALRWFVFLLAGFGLLRCGTQSPPVEDYVKLELNDSLSLFDSVRIELVNPSDTSQIYQVLWNGPLPNPSTMSPIKVEIPGKPAYVVRVRAWDEEDVLGWEMVITEINGKSYAVRTALPPLRPYLVELATLAPTRGQLDPPFQPGISVYDLNLGFLDDTLELRAIPADNRATVALSKNGEPLGKETVGMKISEGSTEIIIQITNRGDRLIRYKVTITRPRVPEPRMRKLKPMEGELVPEFSPSHFAYVLELPATAQRFSYQEFEADSFATAIFQDDTLKRGQKPNSIHLKIGSNDLGIRVFVAQKTASYTLKVNVTAPQDTSVDTTDPGPKAPPPRLLAMDFQKGTLSPPFNDLIHDYTLEVPEDVEYLEFTELMADSNQTVFLGEDTLTEGKLPNPPALREGVNEITLRVANSAMEETTYTIAVNRKPKFRLPSFAHSARIRVNTTERGGNVQSRILGFPLLIRLRDFNFDFAQAQKDGRDLRIAKESGLLLPYHIESWDSVAQSADIWVRMDTLPGNDIQDLAYLCWGNGGALPASLPAAVFQANDGFGAVWHMDTSFSDATGNPNKGKPRNGAIAQPEGLTGHALQCSGSNQGVDFGKDPSLVNLVTSLQVDVWFRSTQTDQVASMVSHDLHFTALKLQSNGSVSTQVHTDYADTDTAANYLKAINMNWRGIWNDDNWHHFVAQYDAASGLFVYWDGKLAASNASARGPLHKSDLPFMVGVSERGDESFSGWVDEVRVHHKTRSADWIRLSYESQKPSSRVVTLLP